LNICGLLGESIAAGFRKIIRIIANLLEKENVFIPENLVFSGCFANRGHSLMQIGPLPGQKVFALPRKALTPLFPMRASAVSAR